MALVAAASLLVALVPAVAWLVAALAFGLIGLAVAEAMALRRVRFAVEGRAAHALYLGDEETVSLAVRSDAARPLRVVMRQLWPSLLAEASSSRAGLMRPGDLMYPRPPIPLSRIATDIVRLADGVPERPRGRH